ncbi:unnamed protein product, partial [Tenebrio molitor]
MKKAELLQKINDQPFAFEDSYFTEFSKKSKMKIIEEKTKAEYTKKWRRHKVYYKVILVEDWQGQTSDIDNLLNKIQSILTSNQDLDIGFYGQSYYCEKCDKPYQNKDGHKCK